MERAAPGAVLPGPVEAPFPMRRIVWHVIPIVPGGASRLVVNIFDGSVPVAYEQEVVTNSAPTATITYAIESATRRLIASYTHPDANAASEGCRPGNGRN